MPLERRSPLPRGGGGRFDGPSTRGNLDAQTGANSGTALLLEAAGSRRAQRFAPTRGQRGLQWLGPYGREDFRLSWAFRIAGALFWAAGTAHDHTAVPEAALKEAVSWSISGRAGPLRKPGLEFPSRPHSALGA
jgi:hypothetical protein